MRYFSYYKSKCGTIQIIADEDTIIAINFTNRMGKGRSNQITNELKGQLQEYFSGKRKKFEGTLSIEGTRFEKDVLNAMCKIPYGTTISYSGLAKKSGHPRAYRAAASVCRKNSLPLLVPCHRVVANDGLGGYSSGIAKKKWLLAHEREHSHHG